MQTIPEARDVDFRGVPGRVFRRLARRFARYWIPAVAGVALAVTQWPAIVEVDLIAFGIVAVGLNAIGVVAVGINAVGEVTIGGATSLGLIALGGANSVGLIAIGGVNSAGVLAIGGYNSAGFIVIGRRAYGFYALARIAGRGSFVLSPDRQDWGAAWFFERWAPSLFAAESAPRVE